jgi:hypothetical protein
MKNSILGFGFLIAAGAVPGKYLAAQTDTSHRGHNHSDSSGWIVEHALTKNKFFGNAMYYSGSFSLANMNEWDVNLGRSYVKVFISGGPYVFTSHSWGAGFGRTTRRGQAQNMLKAFYEYSFFVFPPYDITVRGDYIYLPAAGQHYLRPSIGFNLLVLDVLYNYSFKLNGADNLFKHGVTFRLKKFTNSKNWEKKRPVKC